MPAIDFNGRDAVAYGATQLRRVYAGDTLVWSKAAGLPYSTACSPPWGAAGSSNGGWTVTEGEFGKTGVGSYSQALKPSRATVDAVTAYDVAVSAQANVTGSSGSPVYIGQVMARAVGADYYAGEWTQVIENEFPVNKLRIIRFVGGVRTVLAQVNAAPDNQAVFVFTIKGRRLTLKQGTYTVSVDDATIDQQGKVGIYGSTGCTFFSFTATVPS